MYREVADGTTERYEMLVADVRAQIAALPADFFQIPGLAPLEDELLKALDFSPLEDRTTAIVMLEEARSALTDALRGLAEIRAASDQLPAGIPPFIPPKKAFLRALLDPVFRWGDVNRVGDVAKTIRRKWDADILDMAIVGGEEAWFTVTLESPGDVSNDNDPLAFLLHARCISSSLEPRVRLQNARVYLWVRPGCPKVDAALVTAADVPVFDASAVAEGWKSDGFDALFSLRGEPDALEHVFENSLRRAMMNLARHAEFQLSIATVPRELCLANAATEPATGVQKMAELRIETLDLLEGFPVVLTLLHALRSLRSIYGSA